MNFINRINEYFERFERIILTGFVIVMLVLSFTQVVLRGVFSTGFTWADDLLRHLVLWVGYIGASIATKWSKHINIDIASRLLPQRTRALFEGIISLFSFLICMILSYSAYNFVTIEKEFQETSATLHIQLWYLQIIMPLGLGIISIRFLINFIQKIVFAINPKK